MAVDYKKQYRPDQLEPFWPNEMIKMTVVVLCTLAVIMLLVTLPVLLNMIGVPNVIHMGEPANPKGATPVGIKPEWYFLGTYQYLRLMPTELLGISGKTLGVLSQGPMMLLILLLPFWYRRRAHERPKWTYRLVITAAILSFIGLTLWGGWPEEHSPGGGERLVSATEYVGHHPVMFILIAVTIIVFCLLIAQERRAIRRILDGPPPPSGPTDDESPGSPIEAIEPSSDQSQDSQQEGRP